MDVDEVDWQGKYNHIHFQYWNISGITYTLKFKKTVNGFHRTS